VLLGENDWFAYDESVRYRQWLLDDPKGGSVASEQVGPDRWDQVCSAFNAALNAPALERDALIREACGDDQTMRSEVERMLENHARATQENFLEVPNLTASFAPAPAEAIGSRIGPYKILQRIGEGGFGVVYMAEQERPIRRRVTLKVIKPGMDSAQIIARFEAERQALAMMDHPGIAKVFDAGTTDAGRPYFVMELVHGVPVTRYCDEARLNPRERLALFVVICQAVQHAHQKGIIHRDLKPSNVLVTMLDGHPVPKVIDFGVAKAISQQLTDKTMFTQLGAVVGTLEYMSPEQAGLSALDVDTRSDIYSLGVMLYELLTGSTPLDRDRLRQGAYDEIVRRIKQEDPPSPSIRLSGSGDRLKAIAASRGIEPEQLKRSVRGDLDWIVMKALAKERHRRYESSTAFSQDIERFLNHEPVTAGPPTAAYRFRKFVRRNRPQVVAASLVLLALVVGIIGTTMGLFEANRQRRQAEKRLTQIEKANEILGSVFTDLDPTNDEKHAKPLGERLGERLDQATAQIEGEAIGDPLTVARMQFTLGKSQLGLGYPEKAIALLTKARATFTNLLGFDHADTLATMNKIAGCYYAAGKRDRALALYEETLALMKSKLGSDHRDTVDTMNSVAHCYQTAGKLDRALPLFEGALALAKSKLGSNHRDALSTMDNLANCYEAADKFDRALPLYEETLALKRSELGPDHHSTLTTMNNLAGGYRLAGHLDRAFPLYEETLTRLKSKLGSDHPDTLTTMNNLAGCYWVAKRLDRSIPLFEECLKLTRVKSGEDHPETMLVKANLGVNYRDAGRLAEALPLLEEANRAVPKYFTLRFVRGQLLDAYIKAGRNDKAATLAKETLTEDRAALPAGSPQLAGALAQAGSSLLKLKNWTDAEPVLRESLTIRETKVPDDWRTFSTKSLLGGALLGQKKYAEAEPLLRAGYEGLKQRAEKIAPDRKDLPGEALDRLIELAEATNNPDDAKAWKDEKAKLAAVAKLDGTKP
jgi:eukaryotic-like serine/threonine-protein kinase